MNGGIKVEFRDAVYSPVPANLTFDSHVNEMIANDPVLKYMEQELIISNKQIELSRSLSLPKLETGYHYQTILGQTFQGIHVGFSIPLWENKNTVKTQKASLLYHELNLNGHQNMLFYDYRQKFENERNLKITLTEYESLFVSYNNLELLDKSLASGQISTIEYFMEMNYYFDALRNYLNIEKAYHQTIAELYKYKL
jgi:outer membrane protein TolC